MFLYIAIIGDIKESKKIEDRNGVQERLKEVLNFINETYEDDIASKFMITLGDEFQGLIFGGENVMNIIMEIERKIYPIKIRFGVGIGAITTYINSEMPLGADGPAYYKARSAINYLKKNEKRKQVIPSDIRIEIEGDNDNDNDNNMLLLNTILSLMNAIKEDWSSRQREVIWDMLEHQDNQLSAAKRLSIKQPSVQKSLVAGKYYAYKAAVSAIGNVLAEIRRKNV